MHPYRDIPTRPARRHPVDPEDLVLYGMLMGIGAIPVIIALIERIAFGFDATLGLMMLVVGAVGLLVARARSKQPT